MGKLGLLHAGLFNVLPGTRLVGLADTSDQVLRAIQSKAERSRLSAIIGRCWTAVRPDLVAIATPTWLALRHRRRLRLRGRARLHREAAVPASCRCRAAAAVPCSKTPRVEHGRLHDAVPGDVPQGQELIELGVLGRLQMLRSTMYVAQLFRQGKGWRYDPAVSGGGVLMTQNSHLVDMLLWMFGRVRHGQRAHVAPVFKAVEDHAHVFFQFASGLHGFLDASWSARHYRTPTMAIHVQGEAGTLDVNDDRVALFLVEAVGDGRRLARMAQARPLPWRAVRHRRRRTTRCRRCQFLDAIRGAGTVESDVALRARGAAGHQRRLRIGRAVGRAGRAWRRWHERDPDSRSRRSCWGTTPSSASTICPPSAAASARPTSPTRGRVMEIVEAAHAAGAGGHDDVDARARRSRSASSSRSRPACATRFASIRCCRMRRST